MSAAVSSSQSITTLARTRELAVPVFFTQTHFSTVCPGVIVCPCSYFSSTMPCTVAVEMWLVTVLDVRQPASVPPAHSAAAKPDFYLFFQIIVLPFFMNYPASG